MKAVISYYDSPYFPFCVSWKIGSVKHSNVFETAEQAERYITGWFGKVQIIERTRCDMKLTEGDKQLLRSWNFEEREFAQIEEAFSASKTKYSLNGKRISRQKAIELLGREGYLSGIARSAFHYTAARETQTGDCVIFDSHELLR